MNKQSEKWNISFEDLTKKLFDIPDMDCIEKCSDQYFDVNWNEQCTRNEAMSRDAMALYALQKYEPYLIKGGRIYLSQKTLRADGVRDYLQKPVFPELAPQLRGWLLLIDPSPYESWNHECIYCFLVDEEHVAERKWSRFISGEIHLEEYKENI